MAIVSKVQYLFLKITNILVLDSRWKLKDKDTLDKNMEMYLSRLQKVNFYLRPYLISRDLKYTIPYKTREKCDANSVVLSGYSCRYASLHFTLDPN